MKVRASRVKARFCNSTKPKFQKNKVFMKKLMYFAAALLVLVGCNKKDNAIENTPANIGTISGTIELPKTPKKIAAPTGWESETEAFYMNWEENDQIYIYNNTECHPFTAGSGVGTNSATFEGELLSDMSEYKVAYGYDPQSTSTDYTIPYIEGNYRPFADGTGANDNFTINNFGPVIGLPLKGTDALSKIEVVLIDDAEKTLATYTMTFATALALNTTTATMVYVPIQYKEGATTMAIHFYKKVNSKDVMIMSKATKTMPDASKVNIFPELTMNPANGHEYVDLGLSVKWASMNVGATAPQGYGVYIMWGERSERSERDYAWSTYKYCNGSDESMTKYCVTDGKGYNGFMDGKTILDPADDIATAEWGGGWRTPTQAEAQELADNCTWTWTENYNGTGINGYTITSNVARYQDNSIFLPAAGYRLSSQSAGIQGAGYRGDYWTSSLDEGCSFQAWGFGFYYRPDLSDINYGAGRSYYRCDGHSVRPVLND